MGVGSEQGGKEPVITGVFLAGLLLAGTGTGEGGETAPSLQNVPSETEELNVYPPAPLSHHLTMIWGLSPPYTGLCESPEKSPRAESRVPVWQATPWGVRTGQDTVGWASAAAPVAPPLPGLQGLGNILRQQEKSHLTSAPGAKLRLRKHLLKEGREALQGTESPDPRRWWVMVPP